MLKRPRLINESPTGMLSKNRPCRLEILIMIGAEINSRAIRGMAVEFVEKRGLEEAVFVMPFLRPRIREEDKHLSEFHGGGQDFQKETGVGSKEVKTSRFCAHLFAVGAFDATGVDVDSDADDPWIGLCVGDQEVPVATAEFAYDLVCGRQDRNERLLKSRPSLVDRGKKAGRAIWFFQRGIGIRRRVSHVAIPHPIPSEP